MCVTIILSAVQFCHYLTQYWLPINETRCWHSAEGSVLTSKCLKITYFQIMLHSQIHSCQMATTGTDSQDDVIKWKLFPRYWPFVRGIHRSPVNSPHKGQWRRALMFDALICARMNGWVNNREAGDLRRHQAHCDVIVMWRQSRQKWLPFQCICSSVSNSYVPLPCFFAYSELEMINKDSLNIRYEVKFYPCRNHFGLVQDWSCCSLALSHRL